MNSIFSRNANRRRGVAALVALIALALVASACSSDAKVNNSTTTAPATTTTTAAPSKKLYVSLGDSYAAGYQPAPGGGLGTTSTAGYAYQLVPLAAAAGRELELVNFGCAGATTASILNALGCAMEGPGAPKYPTLSQADAASKYIAANQARMGLITVSISGNDVTACAKATDVVGCVSAAVASIKANLSKLLTMLRTAAGPDVPIVGITYPDVILGNYLQTATRNLATLSITAFKSLINPALKTEYQKVNGIFVDVTDATGAYTPFTQTTTLAPCGTIPVAVAKVCELTWYCTLHDIHPKPPGYKFIAQLIVAALPPL
jgi:lysophospholipase L1-like esterase